MKTTIKQLRRIIKETILNEYGPGNEYNHLRGSKSIDLSGFEDPTDLENTVGQLLSAEGEELYDELFGPGSYDLYQDFDADGIYNGGRNIIAALERMGLEQSVPSIYEYVFKQWAKQNTNAGVFTELSYDDYQYQGR
jgi:hypothetical protein